MADNSIYKLRPESRYHSIPITSTQNPDEEYAHVLYHVKNVKRGAGMATTLQEGFRDWALRLEHSDTIIGQDHSPSQEAPRLIYGNTEAGSFLQDFDDLTNVMKNDMIDVATIKPNLGSNTIGAGNISDIRDYLLRNAEMGHSIRTRVWLSTIRSDPLWGLTPNTGLTDAIEAWQRNTNVAIHNLDLAGDCLVAQMVVKGSKAQSRENIGEIFKGQYRMAPEEAAEIVRFAILRGERWDSVDSRQQVMHNHIQSIQAALQWRVYFSNQIRYNYNENRDKGRSMRYFKASAPYRDILLMIEPYVEAYIELVYAMARSLQLAPEDTNNSDRLHGHAKRIEEQLIIRMANLTNSPLIAARVEQMRVDWADTISWAKTHTAWLNRRERRVPFDVYRSMLPKQAYWLPRARSMPNSRVMGEIWTTNDNRKSEKARILRGINLDIDGAAAARGPSNNQTTRRPNNNQRSSWANIAAGTNQTAVAGPSNDQGSSSANVAAEPSQTAAGGPSNDQAAGGPSNTQGSSWANVAAGPNQTEITGPADGPVPRRMQPLGKPDNSKTRERAGPWWNKEDEDGLFDEDSSDDDGQDTAVSRVIKQHRPLWPTAGSSATSSKKRRASPEFESQDGARRRWS